MIRRMASCIWFVCIVAGVCAQDAAAPPGIEGVSELGETFIVRMESAPYPHASREAGHTYRDRHFPKEGHYDDNSVAIFIPAGYRWSGSVDLVIYFHGWSNDIRSAMVRFRLREMLVESGRNAILVFPEGPKNAQDSGCGRLEEPGAFRALADETLAALKSRAPEGTDPALGRVLLSGHSGAYNVLSHALEHGGIEDHVAEVYLLDASYARTEQFTGWAERRESGVLRSIHTEHLRVRNEGMMAALKEKGVPFSAGGDSNLTDEFLAANRITFIHTMALDHDGAVSVLGRFLKASRLDER